MWWEYLQYFNKLKANRNRVMCCRSSIFVIGSCKQFQQLPKTDLFAQFPSDHPHTPPLVPLCKWDHPLFLGLHQDSSLHRTFKSAEYIIVLNHSTLASMRSTFRTNITTCGIAHCNCPTLIQIRLSTSTSNAQGDRRTCTTATTSCAWF